MSLLLIWELSIMKHLWNISVISTLLVIIEGIKNLGSLVYSGCNRGDITSQFIKVAFLMHCLVLFLWKPNPIILIHEKGLVQRLRIPDGQPVWPGDLAGKNNPNKLETILCFPFCLTPCPSISNPYQRHLSFIRSYFSIFTTVILYWTAIISLDLQQFFCGLVSIFLLLTFLLPKLSHPPQSCQREQLVCESNHFTLQLKTTQTLLPLSE